MLKFNFDGVKKTAPAKPSRALPFCDSKYLCPSMRSVEMICRLGGRAGEGSRATQSSRLLVNAFYRTVDFAVKPFETSSLCSCDQRALFPIPLMTVACHHGGSLN